MTNTEEVRIPMRQFAGLKPGLAQELTSFDGVAKKFRTRFRGEVEGAGTKLYSAKRIREIRMELMHLPADTKRANSLPPLLLFRMAKGGVGKTSTAGNVAACLALSGHRVLLIDGDPQSSLTTLFGIDWLKVDVTHIGTLLKAFAENQPVDLPGAVWPLYDGGMLDLIAADITLADDKWSYGRMNATALFKQMLDTHVEFFSQYDAIVIDSAPGSSLLASTLMVAADTVLAVVTPEGQALTALSVLASNVFEINHAYQRVSNPLDVRFILNRWNQNKNPQNLAAATLRAKYPGKLFDPYIREFIGFQREVHPDPDRTHTNAPLIEKEPNSVGTRDVIELTKALVLYYGITLAGVNAVGGQAA